MQQLEKTEQMKEKEIEFGREIFKALRYERKNNTIKEVSVEFSREVVGKVVEQFYDVKIVFTSIYGRSLEKIVSYLSYPNGTVNYISKTPKGFIQIRGSLYFEYHTI